MHTIENTIFVGKVLMHFESLDSTNTYAAEWASKNKPIDGTVISTYNQYKGRGQIGNTWVSEPNKNIAVSLILHPHFLLARDQFQLNQAISLAVYDLISTYIQTPVYIKWPNDIYIEKRKTAGILIQSSLSGAYIQNTVVGIGVNVNQLTFPEHLPNPTSLAIETQGAFSLDEIRDELCRKVEYRYLQLKEGKIGDIQKEYLSRLFRFGNPTNFLRKDDSSFIGEIRGVEESGKLIIQTNKGRETFDIKEVRIVL